LARCPGGLYCEVLLEECLPPALCCGGRTSFLSQHHIQCLQHTPGNRPQYRMLTSWIQTAQPKGQPHLTFAQGLIKDLAYAGLNTSNWGVLAADRRAWRMTLNNLGTNGAKLCPHVNTCFWRFRYSALPLVQAQNSAAPPICKLCRRITVCASARQGKLMCEL